MARERRLRAAATMRRLWCRTRWSILAEEEKEEKEEAEKDTSIYSNFGTIIRSELGHQPTSFGEEGGNVINHEGPLDSQVFCQMNECILEVVPVVEFPVQKQVQVPMVTKVQKTVEVPYTEHVDHLSGVPGRTAGEEEEEEEEDELYSQRSKLFCFRDGKWKERGRGEANLLQHCETHRVRFMLRQEETGKTEANHFVLNVPPYCELQPNAGNYKVWVWSTPDYAEEELKVERFALKFGEPELAKSFKAAFDEAKVLNERAFAEIEGLKDMCGLKDTWVQTSVGAMPLEHAGSHAEPSSDPDGMAQEVADLRRDVRRLKWEAVQLKYEAQPPRKKDAKKFNVLELPLDLRRRATGNLSFDRQYCLQSPILEDWAHEMIWKLRPESSEGLR